MHGEWVQRPSVRCRRGWPRLFGCKLGTALLNSAQMVSEGHQWVKGSCIAPHTGRAQSHRTDDPRHTPGQDKGAVPPRIGSLHLRTQHIKAIKESCAQCRDFKGKYECKDTAFLNQRGEIAEDKLNAAGTSIRNRLIP
uniref:Uncharacterized protein n=1 Tax=Nothoprocta perdicaria TaxID=30464 RepID=A0A8C6YXQ9_NOTPE